MNIMDKAILKSLFFDYWKNMVIIVLAFFLFKSCQETNPSPRLVKVIIPEAKGVFEAKKPVHEAIPKWSNSTTLKKVETVYKENLIDPKLLVENEKLKQDFALANDSIQNFSFQKAIQLNRFSSNFEDENLILNFEGIVQGEVKEITPSYTVKKKTIEVPVKIKETVFRVLVGGAFGVNRELSQVAYRLDLNFQNRKGNIISGEYLKIGSQEFVMVGYKASIINIKR